MMRWWTMSDERWGVDEWNTVSKQWDDNEHRTQWKQWSICTKKLLLLCTKLKSAYSKFNNHSVNSADKDRELFFHN